MNAVVYFFQRADGDIKIGECSGEYLLRHHLKLFSQEYGEPVILGLMASSYKLKQRLWKRFAHCQRHVRRERRRSALYATSFFAPTDELLSFIKENTTAGIPGRIFFERPNKGVVYFAIAKKGIKIGFSSSFKTRQHGLKAEHPEIKFLGFAPGTYDIEHKLHVRFANHSIPSKLKRPSEWFVPHNEILEFIREFSVLTIREARNPMNETVQKFCKYLDCTVGDILVYTEDQE
jgi:hypothetical protein